ncbi:MAG TPA: alpha/beta fold hydrolase [Ohtaekwangia sp.]|uniref:alpha/beta fold hydrolase n=1 Tax=Ohtaekwangia sp. TaxID=2066019 RepID=UPI002F920D88
MLDYTPLIDTGEGEPMLLLHGLFGNLSNWSRVVDEFSTTHRVLVPRLPLYSSPVSRERLNDLTNYIADFVDHHGFSKVTIMGNSLGGHIALLYAWQHPSRVYRLVLAGSSGIFENSFGGTFPRVKDYDYIKEKVASTFYKQEVVTKELVDEVYDTVQSRSNTLSIIGLARAAQRHNITGQLSDIYTPTLLIWGLQDVITPPEVALEFHRHLPLSSVVFLDHCGHVPMMEQPVLFNRHVRKFLA